MNTSPVVVDRLYERIFNRIYELRGNYPELHCRNIAESIIFIVRYTHGPGVHPEHISMPFIITGQVEAKISVVVHKEAGQISTVIENRVPCGGRVLDDFATKLNDIVEGLLAAAAAAAPKQ
ncbi:hypothetical protein BDV95DRAFT_353052 [Massariosphaeria phaeospora]|uniref:Uncharacterized protein n=1 Tax=Massariosphaeria phaeospora TaxID=100035 RepID=A0A7C8I958_9PLEO|nr:hypothetical protein BDV95DRAFT_353052 [Massariosphaeria phaeospora]